MGSNTIKPIFFTSSQEFRKWFIKNHLKEKELYVGFHKVHTGKPSLTWSQSVDEALCFGWIDGVRRSMGEEGYNIRFTPRKPGSNWSAVNMKKIEELTKKGLMYPAGLEIYKQRKEEKTQIYSYEKEPVELSKEFEKKFKSNKEAWKWLKASAPGYQKQCISWVMTAKQEETRLKRLEELITDSAAGQKLKQYRLYTKKK